MKTELEKLRDAEARLEDQIASEQAALGRALKNLNRLALQLSDCKKAIGQLTLVKMRTV